MKKQMKKMFKPLQHNHIIRYGESIDLFDCPYCEFSATETEYFPVLRSQFAIRSLGVKRGNVHKGWSQKTHYRCLSEECSYSVWEY